MAYSAHSTKSLRCSQFGCAADRHWGGYLGELLPEACAPSFVYSDIKRAIATRFSTRNSACCPALPLGEMCASARPGRYLGGKLVCSYAWAPWGS